MANGFEGRAGWLMRMLRKEQQTKPRLALLDRIALAPRQSLALVEAEGRRILVATSAEGGPAFYPLDEKNEADRSGKRASGTVRAAVRRPGISW
jgi:hypothetical protein